MLFLQSYEILWSGEHSLLPKSGSLGRVVRKSGLCSLWQVTGSPQPQFLFFFFFFLNKRKRLGLVDAGGPCWVCRSCPQCQVLGSIPCCLFRQNVRIITADNLVSFPNIFSLFDFSLSEDLQMGPSPTFFREHFLLSFVLTSKHTRGKSLSWPHDPAFVHHSSH